MPEESNLDRNLEKIKAFSEFFYNKLKEAKKPDWVNVIEWKGKPNLTVQTFDKLELGYDDVDEDAKLVVDKTPLSLAGTSCTFVMGAGLGYLQKQILDKASAGHKVIVVEKEFFLIREMLSRHDFTKYINYKIDNTDPDSLIKIKETSLYFAMNYEEAYMYIGIMDNIKMVDNWNMLMEKYIRQRPLDYGNLAVQVVHSINSVRCNTATVEGAGSVMAKNDIQTLPYILGCPGVKELKDAYKGMPAVTVSTGPSLEKNIHVLQKYQDKVIIIAVAQALRVLLAYDITPDFICTVDYGETNMGHFKGLMHSDVPLVCLNRTYYEILRQYKGPKFIVSSIPPGTNYEGQTVSSLITEKGSLDQGGSVAHTCYSLAAHMGCDPIILIGQDLALTDKSHTSQVDESGVIEERDGNFHWRVTDHRSHLYNEQGYTMGSINVVPGYFGGLVKTNLGLMSFLNAFEAMFSQVKDRKVINCTEGGARIKHTDQMTLKMALERHATTKKDSSKVESMFKANRISKSEAKNALRMVDMDLRRFNAINKACSDGIKSAEMIATEKDKGRVAFHLKKNKKESERAFNLSAKNPLLQMGIFWATKRIHSEEMYVDFTNKSPLQDRESDLLKRVVRNKLILGAVKKSIEELSPSYIEAKKTIRKFMQGFIGHDDKDHENIRIDDAEQFFTKGNFARPLTDARALMKIRPELLEDCQRVVSKALEMRLIKTEDAEGKPTDEKELDYFNEIYLGKEAGADKKFEEALLHIEKAYNLFPDREETIWGMAVTQQNLKNYEDSIRHYEKLNEKFPDCSDYFFECGVAMILGKRFKEGCLKVNKAIEMGTEKETKTGEPNKHLSALKMLGGLYLEAGMRPEAEETLHQYLEKFPYDMEVQEKYKTL